MYLVQLSHFWWGGKFLESHCVPFWGGRRLLLPPPPPPPPPPPSPPPPSPPSSFVAAIKPKRWFVSIIFKGPFSSFPFFPPFGSFQRRRRARNLEGGREGGGGRNSSGDKCWWQCEKGLSLSPLVGGWKGGRQRGLCCDLELRKRREGRKGEESVFPHHTGKTFQKNCLLHAYKQ